MLYFNPGVDMFVILAFYSHCMFSILFIVGQIFYFFRFRFIVLKCFLLSQLNIKVTCTLIDPKYVNNVALC